MEYRIQKDCVEPPIYWIEKLVDNNWQRVFGTTEFSAGASWTALQNQESIVGPAEIAVLFQGERRDTKCRTRDVIWSEWRRNEYRKAHDSMRMESDV